MEAKNVILSFRQILSVMSIETHPGKRVVLDIYKLGDDEKEKQKASFVLQISFTLLKLHDDFENRKVLKRIFDCALSKFP